MDEAYIEWVLQPALPATSVEPRLAWFLCGVQRSGTWMLAGLLDSTGIAGHPHEWFSERTEEANRRSWGVGSDDEYIDCVTRAGTTPNGVFGCKLHWDAVERAPDLAFWAQDQFFVWLRRDPEEIGVSWALAAETGHFHVWDPWPDDEPEFAADRIDPLVRLARTHDAAWGSWFGQRAIEPLELWYDEVVAGPNSATARVLDHLGLPQASAFVRTEASPPSDWLERYRRR
jgi:trehalose 2-sulfotransferase